MASESLEEREKKINMIRRLNSFPSLKGSEYRAMRDRHKINHKILDKEFDFEHYDENITLPDGQMIHDILLIEKQYNATESFFGISFDENKSLLHDISCIDYEIGKTIYNYEIKSDKKNLEDYEDDLLTQLEEIENIPYIKNVYATTSNLSNLDPVFYTGCYIDIQEKYEDWKEYCLFVDGIKGFISSFIPDFEKLNASNKNELIDTLNENYITKDISDYLQNYNLNQHHKAKIDKLINLQLPNLKNQKSVEKFIKLYINQQPSQ